MEGRMPLASNMYFLLKLVAKEKLLKGLKIISAQYLFPSTVQLCCFF